MMNIPSVNATNYLPVHPSIMASGNAYSQPLYQQQQMFPGQYSFPQQSNTWGMQPNYNQVNYVTVNSTGFTLHYGGYPITNAMVTSSGTAQHSVMYPTNTTDLSNPGMKSQTMTDVIQQMSTASTTVSETVPQESEKISAKSDSSSNGKSSGGSTFDDPSLIFKFPPFTDDSTMNMTTTTRASHVTTATMSTRTRMSTHESDTKCALSFLPDLLPPGSLPTSDDGLLESLATEKALRSKTDDADAVVDDIDQLEPSIKNMLCSVPRDAQRSVDKFFNDSHQGLSAN